MSMENVHVLHHPLVEHKLSLLRDRQTSHWEFQRLIIEISAFLCIEATASLPLKTVKISTPLAETKSHKIAVRITGMPILRAGLGMVPALQQLFPPARIGFLGLFRDEESFQPQQYYQNLPENIRGDYVLLLDPMLATGGSLIHAAGILKENGVTSLAVLSVIAAPEGVEKFSRKYPEVPVYTAAMDRRLNQNGYILPGLGDAGDRIFGSMDSFVP